MPKVSEILKRIIRETDCYMIREGKKHEIWYNPKTGEKFPIPRHRSHELKKATANSILKSAGIKNDKGVL